jgi:hypothetical protein
VRDLDLNAEIVLLYVRCLQFRIYETPGDRDTYDRASGESGEGTVGTTGKDDGSGSGMNGFAAVRKRRTRLRDQTIHKPDTEMRSTGS